MKVRKISVEPVQDIEGEEYRFHVPSDTFGQEPWLVDLEENDGRGHCQCPDFVCKRNIVRKKGEDNLNLVQCKHIKRALMRWARREIMRHVREENLKRRSEDR